jgi:RNA polymerase sigma factor (sigma-70 family)
MSKLLEEAVVAALPEIGATAVSKWVKCPALRSLIEVEDIAQIVAMRCLQQDDMPEDPEMIRRYVRKSAFNVSKTLVRSQSRKCRDSSKTVHVADMDYMPSTVDSGIDHLEACDELGAVETALSKIPTVQADAVRRHYLNLESVAEIAETLELSENAVRCLICRLRSRIWVERCKQSV